MKVIIILVIIFIVTLAVLFLFKKTQQRENTIYYYSKENKKDKDNILEIFKIYSSFIKPYESKTKLNIDKILNEDDIVKESLIGIKRAGATAIFTYFAPNVMAKYS